MSRLTKNERIDRLVACLRTQGIKMRELEAKLEALDEWSKGADDMLTELNHALPDPEYDAKCEENAVAVEASLARHAVRLGLKKPELTGSDLCRHIKSRKHWVLAVASDENDATAEFHQRAIVVTDITNDGRFKCGDVTWRYAVPIDHKGEPLTASEVGL
ncbi:hypothetical protein ACTXGL_01570 [Psychrobacter sp. T6-6]|uniref:hypothetical protein n=1 Tax=Psychrobacter sp. T6-6 TaxID=3457452 RepID=UPI003FD56660